MKMHVEHKFRYSEKATKFEKIFHLIFDATQYRQILSGRFFQIWWPSQNIRTLIASFPCFLGHFNILGIRLNTNVLLDILCVRMCAFVKVSPTSTGNGYSL